MQYNKEKFNVYYGSYINNRLAIRQDKERLEKLLEDEFLKEAIDLYNKQQNEKDKKLFVNIICRSDFNNKFFSWNLLSHRINILEKANEYILKDLYQDKEAFPFDINKEHFFVFDKVNNDIICALTDEKSSDYSFNDKELRFLRRVVSYNLGYNVTTFSPEDILYIRKVRLKK